MKIQKELDWSDCPERLPGRVSWGSYPKQSTVREQLPLDLPPPRREPKVRGAPVRSNVIDLQAVRGRSSSG